MSKNKIFVQFIVIFLITTSFCQSAENSINHPVIDSSITLKEALEDLNPSCPKAIKNNQTLLDVVYYSTDGLIHKGQIVIDRRLVDDIVEVFKIAFDKKFPFARVIPISQFNWDDADSMSQNNTSSFNYRAVTNGKKLSNHAHGFAIDVNPLLNPYKKGEIILPAGAVYDPGSPGTLTGEHIIVKTFIDLGWDWGGNWKDLKDYQHFEKVIKANAD